MGKRKRRVTPTESLQATSSMKTASMIHALDSATFDLQETGMQVADLINVRGYPKQHIPRGLSKRAGLSSICPTDWVTGHLAALQKLHESVDIWCKAVKAVRNQLRSLSAKQRGDFKIPIARLRVLLRSLEQSLLIHSSDLILADFDRWLLEWAVTEVRNDRVVSGWLYDVNQDELNDLERTFSCIKEVPDDIEVEGITFGQLRQVARIVGRQNVSKVAAQMIEILRGRGFEDDVGYLCLAVLRETGQYKGHVRSPHKNTLVKARNIIAAFGLAESTNWQG
jgi:hypothetical protein